MKRSVCPDGQLDIFPAAVMAEIFDHPRPDAPLPPLPFRRNEEIDIPRVTRILHVDTKTVHRMLRRDPPLLRGYQLSRGVPFRIEYASVLEHCDNLRVLYALPARKSKASRIPDEEVLPFPFRETMTTDEVTNHLGVVDKGIVFNLIEEGKLDAYKLIPDSISPWRIHKPSFKLYLDNLRRQAGAETAK